MAIERFYTREVSVERLTPTEGDKTEYQETIPELSCHIQAQMGEAVMLADGAFYNLFNMWCALANIKEGDRVIEGEVVYAVKGVSEMRDGRGLVHHLEILLAQPR